MERNSKLDPQTLDDKERNLPELSSMRCHNKIFNNRLSNKFEDLGVLVTGITRDIRDVS